MSLPNVSVDRVDSWRCFSEELRGRLDQDDDPDFRRIAIDVVGSDVETIAAPPGKQTILARIGRCSRWILPHRTTKWETTWPFGYGNVGQGHSYASLPVLDWSLKWARSGIREWTPLEGGFSRRPLLQRIAIPARTAKHPQGTVHTIWTPGSPEDPHCKATSVYEFARGENGWGLKTHWRKDHGDRDHSA